MDRFINSKIEQQTIYEIYRACRLCGAGAGYKMPIIQSVIDLDGRDVELKQKIRECVQIEVHQDDKMPPLICELCVDKVNDFYEFFEMCRQTNKRTRLRLGLPPQALPRGAPDAGDCILGVTEPVYINDDSNEPISKQKPKAQKGKTKKEPEVKIKMEAPETRRDSRSSSRSGGSSSRRSTRGSLSSPPANLESRTRVLRDHRVLETRQGIKVLAPLKSILKKEKDIKMEDNSLLTPRSKRTREKETVKQELPSKKSQFFEEHRPPSLSSVHKQTNTATRIALKPAPKAAPKPAPKPAPKSAPKSAPKPAPKPARKEGGAQCRRGGLACVVCGRSFPVPASLANHLRVHNLSYSDVRPLKKKPSVPPQRSQPARDCQSDMPVKCSNCGRSYATRKSLQRHESTCTAKQKEAALDPKLLGKLKPVQVRVARCDPLLAQETCTVSQVPQEFGLDRNCVYPYIASVTSLRIKIEPGTMCDGMVDIKDEIKDEFDVDESYVHWDSDASSDTEEEPSVDLVINPFAKKKKVDSLSTLTLKTIFSPRCLGKLPRKRRKVKVESQNIEVRRDSVDSIDNIDFVTRKRKEDNINNKEADFDALLRCDIENNEDSRISKLDAPTFNESANIEDEIINDKNRDKDTTRSNEEKEETFTKDSVIEDGVRVDNCDESVNDEKCTNDDERSEDKLKSDENCTLSQDSVPINSSRLEVNSVENIKLETEEVSKRCSEVLEPNESKEKTVVSETNKEHMDVEESIAKSEDKSKETNAPEITNKELEKILFDSENKDVSISNEEVQNKGEIESEGNEENNSLEETQSNQSSEKLIENIMDVIENSSNETRDIEEDLKILVESENNENAKGNSAQDQFEKNTHTNMDVVADPEVTNNDTGNNEVGDKHEDKDKVCETKEREPTVNNLNTEVEDTEKCNNVHNNLSYNGQTVEKPSYKLNMEDLDDISDTEMDDTKLMEALDAQIGESEASKEEKVSDKITLEDLLPDKSSDIKPMDLDNIGDEFNFDA